MGTKGHLWPAGGGTQGTKYPIGVASTTLVTTSATVLLNRSGWPSGMLASTLATLGLNSGNMSGQDGPNMLVTTVLTGVATGHLGCWPGHHTGHCSRSY